MPVRIAVLLVGPTGLLRDILAHAVSSQPDMVLLPAAAAASEALSPVQYRDADVVVYLHHARDDDAEALLRDVLRRRAVLVVGQDGTRARLYTYHLQLNRDMRGELTPQTMLDAIRRGAANSLG